MKEILQYTGISAKRYFPTEKVTQCNNISNLVPRPSFGSSMECSLWTGLGVQSVESDLLQGGAGKTKDLEWGIVGLQPNGRHPAQYRECQRATLYPGWAVSSLLLFWNTHLLFLIFIFTLCNPRITLLFGHWILSDWTVSLYCSFFVFCFKDDFAFYDSMAF